MVVRPFRIADAYEVSSLIRRSILNRDNRGYTLEQLYAIANYYSADNLVKDLDKKFVLVWVDNGSIVATGALKEDELMTLFITPQYRKKGIGTEIMSLLEQEAIRKNLSKVWGVAVLSAVSFYQKLGYKVVGPKSHPEWGEAIVMEKSLK